MLHTVKELHDFTIGATDGEIGGVKDVYFDDERWAVRYLVADTGQLVERPQGVDLTGLGAYRRLGR